MKWSCGPCRSDPSTSPYQSLPKRNVLEATTSTTNYMNIAQNWLRHSQSHNSLSPVSCHWKTKPGLRNASKMLRKCFEILSKYSTCLRFRQGASFWTEAVVGQIQALETWRLDSPEWTRVDESWGSVMDNPHPDPFKGSIVSSNLASSLGNKLAKA